MNPTISPHKLNGRLALLLCTLVLCFCFGVVTDSKAQTGCTINVTGCPPADLISPVCASKDSNGVLGAIVTWTPPSFALSCPGEGGSGYAFNMEFDLNESLSGVGCWEYNKVQRVGTDGGKLRLWQSTGTGNPWVKTPTFYLAGTTNAKLEIHAVENFTVNVYLINTTTLVETQVTPTPALNIVPGDSSYQFSVTPPTPGSYRFRFEFVGGGNNANYVDVLAVNAVVVAGCTGDVNFATVSNFNSPAFFSTGTTTVTYTATCNSCTNPGPLTQTCTFNVVVNGIKASIVGTTPTNCGLANGSVTFDTTLAAGTNAVQYSLDGGAWTTIASPFTITGVSGGAHTLNVRANFNNTSAYCTILSPLNFTVATGADVTAPAITCPTPAASYNTDAGQCYHSATFAATATDACDATPAFTYFIGVNPITFPYNFPKGTTTVKAVATDDAGNSSECTFNVVVVDNSNPVIATCATAQSANTTTGICTAPVPSFTAGLAVTDNCGNTAANVTITQSPVAGTLLGVGPHTITITATDAAGNFSTCTTTFTVNDVTAPSITTCATAQSANTTTGNCTAPVPTFTAGLVVTDNCGNSAANVTITQSPTAGTLVGVGPHTITITATDAAGNFSTCTTTFTVNDATVPVITTCATAQSANTTTGTCTAPVPTFTAGLVVTDNCGNSAANVTITQSPTAGTLVGVGPHTITITATDAAGNFSTCTTTFTVNDRSNPVITTCATAQTAASGSVNCTALVPNFTAGVVVTDNCSSTPGTITITQSPAAGAVVNIGVHTITITATDAAGNSSTCTTTFTVTDNTAPVITTCATAQSASTGAQNCTAAVPVFTAGIVATDNCGSTPANVTITQSPTAGTLVGPGVHTITITVRDQANNASTCTTTFTVTDATLPVITACAVAQSANAAAGCNATVPNFTVGVTATDNCGNTSANVTITQSPAAGTSVGLGVHTITITAKDLAGNTATCTTTFTVSDNSAPVITCPANITLQDDGCGTAVVVITPATATDCSSVTVVGVRSDALPLTAVYPIGVTTITWTATDAGGRTSTCTQTVTVTKSSGAILANYTFLGFTAYPFNANETAPGISSNVTSTEAFAYTGSGTPTGPQAFKANLGTNEALVLQPSSGNNTRYVQYVVSGATLKYYSQFKVYFQAERQPQGATTATLAYSLDNVTYTNVGSLSIPSQTTWYEGVFDLSSIAALNGYNLTQIYFRIYASGSNANGSSDATRLEIDNFQVFAAGVGPTITCPPDQTVDGTAGAAGCTATVNPGTATGAGRCGTPNISWVRSDGAISLGDPFPQGVTTITWKATDENGAFATCIQTITVNCVIVPATGLQLKGNRNGSDVHLNWFTLTEQNTSHFIMERSFDGVRFEALNTRIPAAGNSNAHRNYNLVDKNVAGAVVYYRVKMYDNNGQMRMSNLVAITMNVSKQLRVYPNPVKNFVTIEFGENGKYQIDLIADNGQLITMQKDVEITNSFRTLTMQRNNLISGQYQMRIWNKTTGKINTVRLVYLPANP